MFSRVVLLQYNKKPKEYGKEILSNEMGNDDPVPTRPAHPDNQYSTGEVMVIAAVHVTKTQFMFQTIVGNLARVPFKEPLSIALWRCFEDSFSHWCVSMLRWVLCAIFFGHAMVNSLDAVATAAGVGDYVSVPLAALSFSGVVDFIFKSYNVASTLNRVVSVVLFAGFSILRDLVWLIDDPEEGGVLFAVKSFGELLCTSFSIGPLTMHAPQVASIIAFFFLVYYVLRHSLLSYDVLVNKPWIHFPLCTVLSILCGVVLERSIYPVLDVNVGPYVRSPIQYTFSTFGAALGFDLVHSWATGKEREVQKTYEKTTIANKAKDFFVAFLRFVLPAIVHILVLKLGRPTGPNPNRNPNRNSDPDSEPNPHPTGPSYPLSISSVLPLSLARSFSACMSATSLAALIDSNYLVLCTTQYWVIQLGAVVNLFLRINDSVATATLLDLWVTYLMGLFMSVSVLLSLCFWKFLPCTRDARFIQAINDHSRGEYVQLIRDAHPQIENTQQRKVDTLVDKLIKHRFLAVTACILLLISVYIGTGTHT